MLAFNSLSRLNLVSQLWMDFNISQIFLIAKSTTHGHQMSLRHTGFSQILTYDHVTTILRHEDAEPIQLHIHVETIERQIFPILSALEDEDEVRLDWDWVVCCANIFSRIALQLQRAALVFESM